MMAPDSSGKHRKILLVEDDPDIRQSLQELLESESFEVEATSNGAEALGALQAGLRPCLILLDWSMPVMNGREFLARWRTNEELRQAAPSVIVLTAAVGIPAQETDGVKGFIRKPVDDIELLLEQVRQFCNLGIR